MGEVHSISAFGHRSGQPLSVAHEKTLKRAVAKLVLLGAQVGVSAGQMILLLESGLTVSELLEYLVARNEESS
jgi:hypothetical protein